MIEFEGGTMLVTDFRGEAVALVIEFGGEAVALLTEFRGGTSLIEFGTNMPGAWGNDGILYCSSIDGDFRWFNIDSEAC